MAEKELPWTGERLVTSLYSYGAIDHLHRYALALQLTKDQEVLDIASGEGYGSHLLSIHSKSVIGVDISPEAVLHASQKYVRDNLEFREGSADKIPLSDKSVDAVVSFETIEHHDKHEEMMGEIKRVLRPNGILIMSSPDKLNYTDIPRHTNPFHVKELYREEFIALINKYFSHTLFLNQKSVVGSLIVPDLPQFSYQEFEGDYSKVKTQDGFHSPVYNLCIASNSPISYTNASFFKGKNAGEDENTIAQLKKEIRTLQKDLVLLRKLRLHWILSGFRRVKKIMHL